MSNYNYTSPEIASLEGVIDTQIRWEDLSHKGDRKYFSYHPSEWGRCLRAQQYRHYTQLGYIKVEYKGFDSRLLRLFDQGHSMHDRWTKYFDRVGVLRGHWKCMNTFCCMFDDEGGFNADISENELLRMSNQFDTRIYGEDDKWGVLKPEKCSCGCTKFKYKEVPVIDEDLNFKGSADMILDFSAFDPERYGDIRKTFNIDNLPTTPIVVDMKTCNERTYTEELMKKGTKLAYVIQVSIYVHVLGCEYGILWHENKNDSRMYLQKVERNDELFEKITWQATMMNDMVKHRRLPPPQPTRKSSYDCKDCDFKSLCHKASIWKDEFLDAKREAFYKIPQ